MKRKDLKPGDTFYYLSVPSMKFMVPWSHPVYPDYALPDGFHLSQHNPRDMESDVVQIDVTGRRIGSIKTVSDGSAGAAQATIPGSASGADDGQDSTSPGHYRQLTPEPIDVIESWGLNFRLANVLKYLARAGNKPGVDRLDDLRKARQYLNREIAAQEGRRAWE